MRWKGELDESVEDLEAAAKALLLDSHAAATTTTTSPQEPPHHKSHHHHHLLDSHAVAALAARSHSSLPTPPQALLLDSHDESLSAAATDAATALAIVDGMANHHSALDAKLAAIIDQQAAMSQQRSAARTQRELRILPSPHALLITPLLARCAGLPPAALPDLTAAGDRIWDLRHLWAARRDWRELVTSLEGTRVRDGLSMDMVNRGALAGSPALPCRTTPSHIPSSHRPPLLPRIAGRRRHHRVQRPHRHALRRAAEAHSRTQGAERRGGAD